MATKRDIEAYEKMTRAERRVAICEDVIQQLDVGRYIAHGVYLRVPNGGDELVETRDNPISNKTCYLCGKGAMFVSKVSKFNGVEPFVPNNTHPWDMVEGVSDAFSKDQINDIERLFECFFSSRNLLGNYSNWLDWSTKSRDERLRIICQNIIDNKGKLKPKQLPNYEVELV